MLQWTQMCKYHFKTLPSVLLDVYPKVRLLWVVLVSVFCGTSIVLSIAALTFYSPANSACRFHFLHISVNICDFPFFVLSGHLSSLEKYISVQFPCPFKIEFSEILLWLSCRSSLYILDSSSLLSVWFANVFSHSPSCLFTVVSFVMRKF